MIVFIDDSGDPGFKIDKGSSRTFVFCCVIFDDELDAEKTAVTIKEFRRKINKSDKFEFKFNKSSKVIREKFLQEISNCNFKFRAIVMQKEKIKSEELRSSKESFYKFTMKMVLQHNAGEIHDAKIKLDGRGDRVFRRELLTYLRKHLNSNEQRVINNIRFVDSKRNVLIQLADMIAGTINRKYQLEKTDSTLYWNIIKKKNSDLWEFK
jgi:hypothetical protein